MCVHACITKDHKITQVEVIVLHIHIRASKLSLTLPNFFLQNYC